MFDANDHFVTTSDTLEPIASELPAAAPAPPPGEADAPAAAMVTDEPSSAVAAPAEASAPALPGAQVELGIAEAPPADAPPADAAAQEPQGETAPSADAAAEESQREAAVSADVVAEDSQREAGRLADAAAEDSQREDETTPAPAAQAVEAPSSGGPAARHEWRPRKGMRERPRLLYGVGIVLLLALLAAQAAFEFRDALAARVPATRPLLESACSLVECTIAPLRDTQALSIDASDLQADPAHRGLLQLTATLRNRASYAIAYPDLELTLTDSSDQVVVRRAFSPAEYAGGTSNPAAGIPPNGEHLVRLFIEASATSQAGYRLYLFYP